MKKKIKEIVYFQEKKYTFGTRRKRTELDDMLDQEALGNYYKNHPDEKRTHEKDKEILRTSYLIPIED